MLIINLLGLLLIALIVWWFWLYKPKDTELGEGDLLIVVENGIYSPSRIKLPANKASEISFIRRDATPCAEMVLIPELQISETLPLDQTKTIQLPALDKGHYDFHCQMQMYRGQLIVE